MSTPIRYNEILKETVFLGVLSIVSFSLYIFRIITSGTLSFTFLNWNLFLAALPWIASSVLLLNRKLQKNKLILTGVILSWLAFFPNAPYILTDLFHIRYTSSMPLWYDLILILSYAWTGLMFGFLSLQHLERIFRNILSKVKMNVLITLMFFITGFGIYIGRYLRWNSWDIIDNPAPLLNDIITRILNPAEHTHTWGMTFFMGLFLVILYGSLKYIRTNRIAPE